MRKPPLILDESYVAPGVRVTAEPLVLEVDQVVLGEGPAIAMRDAVERGIHDIGAQVAPATIERRKREGIASTKRFNATGHLANGIAIKETDGTFEITVPADRVVTGRLVELVPAIKEPLSDARVRAALEKADDRTITIKKKDGAS